MKSFRQIELLCNILIHVVISIINTQIMFARIFFSTGKALRMRAPVALAAPRCCRVDRAACSGIATPQSQVVQAMLLPTGAVGSLRIITGPMFAGKSTRLIACVAEERHKRASEHAFVPVCFFY